MKSALSASVLASILAWVGLDTSAAEGCFVDNLPKPSETQQFDAKMRALMLAHVPIEYRNSCGLRDESDQRFFEAIRTQVGCETSEGYQTFFGRYLQDVEEYLFAVNRSDLRTDADFDTYCAIVERIDLAVTVNDEGGIDTEMLQVQAPLFQALQDHVAKTRLDQ